MSQAVIARRCTVARQVAEVYTGLAAVAPWLWLMGVKLAKLMWTELARTELIQTKLVQAELA